MYNFYLSDGWTRYQSSAYKFVNEKVINSQARQRCHNMSEGADLVSISNEGDEQFVANLVKGKVNSMSFLGSLSLYNNNNNKLWDWLLVTERIICNIVAAK